VDVVEWLRVNNGEIKMKESRVLYVVTTNTDLTEGRGSQYPIAYSFNDFTAQRLAHKKGVMGSDAHISAVKTTIVDGLEMVSINHLNITHPTEQDKINSNKRDEKLFITEKARRLGLTDEEIKKLTGSI
jgi:hypothetical protein